MIPLLAIEKALTQDSMNMGIPLQKVSCSVDGKDGAARRIRCGAPRQCVLHGLLDGLKGTSQNQLQKPPVAEQNPVDRFGD